MVDGRPLGRAGRWSLVEPLVEDGFDRPIGSRTDVQGAAAGRFDTTAPKAASQPHDAQAGAKTLFGVWPFGEDPLAQQRRAGADGSGFPGDALDRPVGETPV